MKNKNCLKCNQKIDFNKDRYVLVGTYEAGNTREEAYFHINCWSDYFRDCVQKKVVGMYKNVLGNFTNVLEQAKVQGVL